MDKIIKAPTQNEIINTINDLIDNKQDTLIAGTDLEIIPAGAPILPEGYTQLEYIEGTGTQYIDTGYYGTQNSGAYIRFALTDLTSEGSTRVFGTRNGTGGTGAFAFISSLDATSLPTDKFYIGSNGYASSPTNLDTNWHEVRCNIENDKKVYFDGNLIITGSDTAYTSNGQASIFRRYNQNTYSGKSATAKISIVQIYENAVMVHNYIPCRRDSDDELGMYDLVTNTFLTNSGTGTFIAGADVLYPPKDLINFTNESGYIKGIDSTDVITALGYTPYDDSNPDGYTSNVGTVTSVNNTQPDANGDVTLTIPTVNDGVLTITQNGTSKGTFSANQSTNNTIALTDTTYNAFTGADGTNAGSSGLVPAPSATDNDKYLKGDGTWASVSSSGANTDLSNLTATGEAHFQEPLVSGTNIKTVNNTSLLGSGDIPVGSYSAGTGLSLSGTTFNHSNSVTAGTIGTSSATSGSTISIPYANYDAQGHITSKGTHTHTVTGFLTSSSTQVASSRFDGQWVYSLSSLGSSTAIGNYTLDLNSYLPSTTGKYEVLLWCYYYNNNSTTGNFRIWSDIITSITSGGNSLCWLNANSNSRYQCAYITMPVTRYLYYSIEGHSANDCRVVAMSYHRLGTNS